MRSGSEKPIWETISPEAGELASYLMLDRWRLNRPLDRFEVTLLDFRLPEDFRVAIPVPVF